MAATAISQTVEEGIDPEALIDQILLVDKAQRDAITDLVMDAEFIEGKRNDDGEFEEKERFIKKIYVKYLQDTALYHEEYVEYYKDGEKKEQKDLEKEAEERIEQRKKRNTRNVGFPMLRPFYREQRENYDVTYAGVAAEKIEGLVCHRFNVTALGEEPDMINGEYYFEAESFHLVHVDFEPAKLTKKMMFRLSQLDMSITYEPALDDYWLPVRFEIQGKGRAALFFGVNFAAIEYYSNHQINTGLDIAMFEVEDGK
jgi:hypothetical protein